MKKIIIFYIVSIVVSLLAIKFININEQGWIRIVYELSVMLGGMSLIGFVISIIPTKKDKYFINVFSIFFNIGLYVFFLIYISRIAWFVRLPIFLLILYIEEMLYFTSNNLNIINRCQMNVGRVIYNFNKENKGFEEENEIYNDLLSKVMDLGRTMGVIKTSWLKKIFEQIFSTDKIKPIKDLYRKYPNVNYDNIIGYSAFFHRLLEYEVQKFYQYESWLEINQTKLRDRSFWVRKRCEQLNEIIERSKEFNEHICDFSVSEEIRKKSIENLNVYLTEVLDKKYDVSKKLIKKNL